MKNLVTLLIFIPTAISVLLFIIAGFAYNDPQMLNAAENPALAICCIIAGVIMAVPILVAIVIWTINFFSKK